MAHADHITASVAPDVLHKVAHDLAFMINKDKSTLGINCIAVTGVSGLVVGGVVSYLTTLPLVIVRKEPKCDRHSGYDVEYIDTLDTLDYCFVDDLISSKNTIRRVIKSVENTGRDCELKKIYLYHEYSVNGNDHYNLDDKSYPLYATY
jgi:adenine/guanine phosphoribosyltransferase-like PRPP-binding protein